MNVPNAITLLRLTVVPIIIYLVYLPIPLAKWGALILFSIGMASDIVDGLIARKKKMITNFGIFLDPIADKILILSMFFVLGSMKLISFWIPLIILWRELLVTGIRSVASSHGQVIGANWMGKTKSVFQTTTIFAGLLLLAVQSENWLLDQQLTVAHVIVISLSFITVGLSIIFAFIFTYWNRTLLIKTI